MALLSLDEATLAVLLAQAVAREPSSPLVFLVPHVAVAYLVVVPAAAVSPAGTVPLALVVPAVEEAAALPRCR